MNYESGNDQYINNDIFTGGYFNTSENKYDILYSKGQIVSFKDNKNRQYFSHDWDTKIELAGSPMIDINKNVIGINLQNNGVFISVIIEKLISKKKWNK